MSSHEHRQKADVSQKDFTNKMSNIGFCLNLTYTKPIYKFSFFSRPWNTEK